MHDHSENFFSTVILTIALSIHSILEGFGIGASGNTSAIKSAFIAISVHKGFTAFSLAQGLMSSGCWEDHSKRKYFYISIGTFIFVSLFGISIGWGISSTGEDNFLAAVLNGITSGSFVYVTVVEVLPHEAKKIKRERIFLLPVIFSFVAGYCVMMCLALWV